MRPIAQDIDWIRPPMYGRRSSRGGAFSSVPQAGMLICPCLSAPPRLPPAPPALALEAAWYIANLTAHSCATRGALDGSYFSRLATLLASLDRNLAFDRLACFSPTTPDHCRSVSFASRSPAIQSLLPRLARVPRPTLRRHAIHSSAAPSLCALRMHAQQALPNVLLLPTQPAVEVS